MRNKNQFVAALFVLSLCALLVGGSELYEYFDFKLHSQTATMELANPDKKVVLYEDSLGTRTLDVKYVSEAGEVVVPQKVVSLDMAKRLAEGEKISLTYMTNNTKRVFYYGARPQIPWGWLIVGVLVMIVAIYALRLRKREAGIE
jgi:hypothetical protein